MHQFHHFVNSLLTGSVFFSPISPFPSWFLPSLVPSVENPFGSVSSENKFPTSGLGGQDGGKMKMRLSCAHLQAVLLFQP